MKRLLLLGVMLLCLSTLSVADPVALSGPGFLFNAIEWVTSNQLDFFADIASLDVNIRDTFQVTATSTSLTVQVIGEYNLQEAMNSNQGHPDFLGINVERAVGSNFQWYLYPTGNYPLLCCQSQSGSIGSTQYFESYITFNSSLSIGDTFVFRFDDSPPWPQPVPEPSAMWLLGVGIPFLRRRR
jgi:hypothetical protein